MVLFALTLAVFDLLQSVFRAAEIGTGVAVGIRKGGSMAHKDHASKQNLDSNQVRGKDLNSQMKESGLQGDQFRSKHQGTDQIEGQNNTQGRNSNLDKD